VKDVYTLDGKRLSRRDEFTVLLSAFFNSAFKVKMRRKDATWLLRTLLHDNSWSF
jgi:hypothetical protein